MRASKTILSILHRGLDRRKQDGRVMVLDEKSAETKVLTRLSPRNRWLTPNVYLKIFGKKFMKNMGFDVDKPKSGTKK